MHPASTHQDFQDVFFLSFLPCPFLCFKFELHLGMFSFSDYSPVFVLQKEQQTHWLNSMEKETIFSTEETPNTYWMMKWASQKGSAEFYRLKVVLKVEKASRESNTSKCWRLFGKISLGIICNLGREDRWCCEYFFHWPLVIHSISRSSKWMLSEVNDAWECVFTQIIDT